jgi:TolB-like protein
MTAPPPSYLKVLSLAAIVCLGGGGCLVTAAGIRTKVAILDFINAGDAAALKNSAPEMLGAAFVENGEYSLVDRDRVRQAQEEQNPGQSGRVDQKTAAGIGKALGAKLVVVGGVQRVDANYIINIIFVDAETGLVVSRKRFTAQSNQELAGLYRQAVSTLWTKEAVPEPAGEQPRTAQALPAPKPPAPAVKKKHSAGEAALGLLYPGVALKYWPGSKSAWEVRAQSGAGVLALGPRYYHYFPGKSVPRLFYAIEADYITFRGKVSEGYGFAGGFFAGGELPLSKQTDLLVDFGPAYVNLKDKRFSLYADGFEFVLNISVYLHFKVFRDTLDAKITR